MSSRYGRWELLGSSRDPVPGDELAVQQLADVHTATADTVRSTSTALRRLAQLDGWRGKAAERFAEAAEDVAGDLARAEQRYRESGAALKGFVGPLREARDESWGALRDAEQADAQIRASAGDPLSGVPEPTPEQLWQQARRAAAHDEGVAALGAARTRLQRALTALDTAASRCAQQVRAAAEHGKDSRWDDVKGGLRDVADWARLDVVVKVLGAIALAIAVAAVVVALIATAPAWLGPALLVGGAVVGGASLAANTTLLVSDHEKGSWTAVGLDLFGLATLGASRAFTAAARQSATAGRLQAAAGARSSARTAEARRLASTARGRAAVNAGGIADDTNPLARWAAAERFRMSLAASARGEQAATAVRAPALRDVAAEVQRLQALPGAATDPAVQAALTKAAQQLRTATVLDRAADGGTAIGAVDLGTDAVTGQGAAERFDDYVARVEWRLSR